MRPHNLNIFLYLSLGLWVTAHASPRPPKNGDPKSCESRLDSRADIISQSHGEVIPFSFLKKGVLVRAQAFRQNERESRIDIGPLPKQVEDYLRDVLLQFNDSASILRKIVRDYLRTEIEGRNLPLSIRPLASRYKHFHSSATFPQLESIENPEKFTQVLEDKFHATRNGGESWESVSAQYVVGAQREHADYYDNDALALAEAGVAIRIKQWQSLNEKEPGPRRTLFLKVDQKVKDSLFHDRNEIQFPLDADMSEADALEAAKALLSACNLLEATKAQSLNLRKIADVDNLRYGLDLSRRMTDGSYQKVGYVAVDHFSGHDLRSTTVLPREAWAQIEVEVLPEHAPEAQTQELQDMIRQLASTFDGKITTTPKYLQILRR